MRHWDNKTMTTKGESDYYTGLEPKAKLRYKKKIDLISSCDLYTIRKDEMMTGIEKFRGISYPDLFNYFLFALSSLTKEELKVYKALESYNQFVSGWVKEVLIKEFSNGRVLVTGRVSMYVLTYYQSQFLSPVSYVIGITIKSYSSCDRERVNNYNSDFL